MRGVRDPEAVRPGVSLVTLGCKVNQTESDAIADELASAGIGVTVDDVPPSIVIVNTCTVTGEADAKARKAVRRALSQPGEPRVIVTGCLAAVDPAGVAALGDRVSVEPDKTRVAAAVVSAIGRARPAGVPERPARRARVQVKVQDGCDAFCAYCIVPYARGVPRSVASADVLAEVARLRSDGVGEVVLTGINIGRYSDGSVLLPGLVGSVVATGIGRVRVSSIEPDDITADLLDVMRHPAVARHLHVPLQSGCDETLAAMGRRYDTARYAGIVAGIREALPDAAITTDLLVGFPGETDEQFEHTLAFVRRIGFSRLHVFRYSARPGTAAAARTDQIPAQVRTDRSERARALGDQLASEWAAARVGSLCHVLVERVDRGRAEGTSGEYVRVSFDVPAGVRVSVGEIVPVSVTHAEGPALRGTYAGPGHRRRP